jgi:hypothetical protein
MYSSRSRLVDDFDLMDFLNNLAVHAADVTGTSAVGLMLTDHTGTLRFMAASTADARLLELFQLQHSEGPCVDCHRNGEPVQETDLANAVSRWPTFAPRAVAAGIPFRPRVPAAPARPDHRGTQHLRT